MKKIGFLGKIILWVNILVVVLLAISFITPYIAPRTFPTLSLLSLAVSPLLLLNLLFAAYWLIRLRKQILWSLFVLIVAYFHFNSTYEFSSEGDPSEYTQTLKVLSYNVRLFNAYEKNPTTDASELISEVLQEQDPDVICIQEYYKGSDMDFSAYPYRFIHFKNDKVHLGHAIFSKYPIHGRGGFEFKRSGNNAIYVNVVKGEDTLRVYNVHLQSLGIEPSVDYLQDGDKERLRQRMAGAFIKQQGQMEAVVTHKEASPHPVILCGDLNNTSFSFVYRKIKKGMTDAFEARGGGLGATFSFDSYPMRIDYIFTSTKMDVITFETIKKTFSDHYPISATLGWH